MGVWTPSFPRGGLLVLPHLGVQDIPANERAFAREAVAARVAANRAKGLATLHIGVHSFTPVLDGVVRGADVGLLYDPARPGERAFCLRWQQALRSLAPALAVRRNAPYRGASDGLTTWLRRAHPGSVNLGLELEMNQKFLAGAAAWATLCAQVTQALGMAIATYGNEGL